MRLQFYPEPPDSTEEGAIQSFIRKDLKKRPDLRLLVEDFFDKVRNAQSLDPFFRNQTIAPLKYINGDLYEMRIPQKRGGGVVRIYFIKHPGDDGLLVLLDGELKKDTAPGKTGRAEKRMKDYLK